MGAMASQITSLTILYSKVYSGADQRKYQSSTSLAFVRGIHRGPVNSPHKWPVKRKMFPFDDVIMKMQELSVCVPYLEYPVQFCDDRNGRICLFAHYTISLSPLCTLTWRHWPNEMQVTSVECVSKIKTILPIIFHAMYGLCIFTMTILLWYFV